MFGLEDKNKNNKIFFLIKVKCRRFGNPYNSSLFLSSPPQPNTPLIPQ